ncbi:MULTISPECIES: response regulator [Brachybacterium]|uniref:DNA-binding response regulator n=1 Tax=Brachybacterium alimentarium TaxID=47845 RepID=A0A2A3YHN5_9MICO|nr:MULTISPECIES: response regulator transcription factor [Brachybacterium]PCC35002.1 DNA-binding response regulator [Brachybacterium alimentarium]PCC38788.1 DNA-binding response regulator [Brachybacterium alimentarium]RCS65001.1 DNA-binding response regulator [Brachybacterium sp. JB7]RCS68833.1 DNA-binding response regulator [Brachybacterium alimentarium]RCS76131.1 DNA-binding response regulator [Brachybacterium alimentarium]
MVPSKQSATRVLIVDDQSMIRGGFEALLNAQEGLEVVGTAADGAGITEVVRRTRPDVVLMDIRMPHVGGLDATRTVLAMPGTPPKIIMLTTFDADEYVFAALRAGASGFLLKDSTPEELVQAVRVVAGGDSLLAPRVTRALIADFVARPARDRRASTSLNALTERELDVLLLVARGLANREIADELVMAEQTVKSHVSRMLSKLALRDRTQLVVAAYESGLVRAGS